MLIIVDPHNGVPVYRQVMDQIKFQIASGMIEAGDELPSTRTLSSQLGVNPMTISKSYSFLEKEGVLERRPGRPLVVSTLQAESMQEGKLEHLRQSLAPTVTVIRQLGVDPPQALDVLRQMLEGAEEKSREKKEKSK